MRIERIELVHVRIPLTAPFRISSGAVAAKDAIVVVVYAEGLVGYGEASPMSGSFYSEETPESTWACLTSEILPRIISRRNLDRADLIHILDQISGNCFAKAGIETAFWDFEAKQKEVPLYKLLGGSQRKIESGLAVGICGTLNELLHTIDRHLTEGYKRIKIKIEPGWDLEPVRAVRKSFGSFPLMVDANAAYERNDIPIFKELDQYGLMMLEQPLKKDDLEGHAELQSQVRTPVCLDESAEDVHRIKRAIELGSCRIINIKIQRMGGLAKALEAHDLCQTEGIPVWAGTMPELGIGSLQAIHLGTMPNFSFSTDVESSSRWFIDDIIDPWIVVKDGLIEVPDGVGYGAEIDERRIKKYAVRSEVSR